jgi:acetyl esterase/lipase
MPGCEARASEVSMSADEERARQAADVSRKTAVLELPGMDTIEVKGEVRYGAGGTFDLYVAALNAPAPTVLFVYGFPDARYAQGLRRMAAYTSWGRLLASSGMNAVAYSYRDPVGDLAALLAYLREHAGRLGIDGSRLGIWAASGNVPTALHLLMTQPADTFRAAALLYGYMLDVPEAAEQFGIAVPARGRPIDDMPRTLPLLVLRAGRDQTPLLNTSLDAFVAAALARNLPLTLVNQADAPHAFDLLDDREASRAAIRGVLRFFHEQLTS